MLFVNYNIRSDKETLLSVIKDNNLVVESEKFDTSRGKPKMHVKTNGSKLKIKCELTERPTKDNGFLEGTYFIGKISEKDGNSRVRGIILTAPIYHLFFLMLFAFFIYQCFAVGGFSPIPIILLVFDGIMFKDEFRKQSLIKRYVFRAFKITYAKVKNHD